MKKVLGAALGAVALFVSVPASAAAQNASADPAEMAEARAIIAIMFPPTQREQMMQKLMNDILVPIRASFPKAAMEDPGLKAVVDAFLNQALAQQHAVTMKHFPAVLEAMAVAYSNEFTLAELKEVRRFADSPAGGHYLSKSVSMVGDPAVARANQQLFAAGKATTDALLPQFKEDLMTYMQAHPEVAERIAAESKPK